MTSIRIGRFGLLLVAALLAGCASAGPPPQPASPLPPRPAELRLDGVDPCTLLTPPQRGQLGVSDTVSHTNTIDGFRSPECQWTEFARYPYENHWLARAVVKQGAGYALGSEAGVHIEQVGGYPAIQTWANPVVHPNQSFHCIYVIDVAEGENLLVQYNSDSDEQPGMTPQVACGRARKVAELMVQTLIARAKN